MLCQIKEKKIENLHCMPQSITCILNDLHFQGTSTEIGQLPINVEVFD